MRACVVRRASLGLALALLGPGCVQSVGRGSELYYEGRYIEAAHALEKTEPRLAEATPVQRAVYGLYRGATLLRLGDLDGAQRWLSYCQRLEQANPGALGPQELTLLQETLIALRADIDRRAAAGRF